MGMPPSTSPAPARRLGRLRAGVGRDLGLVLPGMFISIAGFTVLVVLLLVGAGTFVVWVGAVILPLTLVCSRAFAQVSRARVRHWGADVPTPAYRTATGGIAGRLRLMADGRRWLDLLFETVIALPVRTVSFVVTVSWIGAALGGLTYWFWGVFLPAEGTSSPLALWGTAAGLEPATVDRLGSFPVAAATYGVIGLVCALTGPLLVHALALLEVLLVRLMLGATQQASADSSWQGPRADRARDPSRSWLLVPTSIAALALVAVNWPVNAVISDVPPLASMVTAVALGAALVLAVVRPLPALVLSLVAAAAATGMSQSPTGAWPWPIPVMIAFLLTLLVASLTGRWQHAAIVLGAGVANSLTTLLLGGGAGDNAAWANEIVTASIGTALVAVGGILKAWLGSRAALTDAERLGAEEMQRRSELEERNRIARELHDVVAHSMSVISVQATTARFRIPGIEAGGPIAAEFDSIAHSSREALAEMRSLLRILRGGQDAETAPQPSAVDIGELVTSTRQAGIEVDLTLDGFESDDGGSDALGHLPPSTGLTVFRIVQEALSNAVRHSPGADIAVGIRRTGPTSGTDGMLQIDVTNSAPPPQPRVVPPSPGAGLGLSGVRERVAALGGSLEAGPTDDGGYCLYAQVPVP
jgi:signal transduction histidine kinase